jgi:cobyrinic acid a,c-diamide synthase
LAGVRPGDCRDTGRLTRFGYVTLRAGADNLLCAAGETIPAHEFHHWDCTDCGADFTAAKPSGRRWDAVVATERLYAGFPHFHFYADPRFAERFYQTCLEERHSHAG